MIVIIDCLQYVRTCCNHIAPFVRQIRYPTITNPPKIPTSSPSINKINLNCLIFKILIKFFFIYIPHFEDIINYRIKNSKL